MSDSVSSIRSLPCSISWLASTAQPKQLAVSLTKRLKEALWSDDPKSQAIPLISEGRALVKKFSKSSNSIEAIELDRYVNAIALRVWPSIDPSYHCVKAEPKAEFGLTRLQAAKNPDFVDFNKQFFIRAPRAHFGHQSLPAKAGQPQLYLEGKVVPWDVVKKRIFGKTAPDSMRLPSGWKYIESGLVPKDLIGWIKLEPFCKIDNPTKEFFLEVVTNELGTKHSWVRLIDKEGNVISVGFASTLHAFFPLRSHIGKLASPDPLEYSGSNQHSVRYPITKIKYEQIKERIERDQREGNLFFNAKTRNCSTYTKEILEEIGIKIDNSEYPSSMFLRETSRIFGCKIPPALYKILHAVTTIIMVLFSPILYLLILCLGGAYKDKALTTLEKTKGSKWSNSHRRPFSSIKSFFQGSDLLFSTGWKMSEWLKSQKNVKTKDIPVTPWNERKSQKG